MIGIYNIFKSFSDFKSIAFCKFFSNTDAVVATMIVKKIVKIQREIKSQTFITSLDDGSLDDGSTITEM